MLIKFKPVGQTGLFDHEENKAKLSTLGNPLEKLGHVIDFEMFRPELEKHMLNHDKKSNAGARPHDVVRMFKLVLLKRFYALSDEQAEYQATDRLSFRAFLGLSSGDRVPDSRTIWLFQDTLVRMGLEKKLFEKFHACLEARGLIVNEGKIVDASFVEVPRQRNSKEDNAKIKEGEGFGLWADKPRKQSQKDVEARWAKKNGVTYYGYKNHVKMDAKSKFIDTYHVTPASVHDSQVVSPLLSEGDKDQDFHADSAYVGEAIEKTLTDAGLVPQIIERAFRGKPLTDEQKERNRVKSQTRCRVEHAFGFVTNSMGDFYLRTIGFMRAKGVVGLINLVYNLCRYEQIMRLEIFPFPRLKMP
jgi:IS5 family transposase